MDAQANLATAIVAIPPNPAGSGTQLTVGPGQGVRFPAVPFNVTAWPARLTPDPENAEILRVTAISGDIFTVLRAQEGTLPVTIQQGYRLAATITKKTLTDLAASIGGVTVSGPLTPGYVLTLTSPTSAVWAAPTGGTGPVHAVIGSTLTMPFTIGA